MTDSPRDDPEAILSHLLPDLHPEARHALAGTATVRVVDQGTVLLKEGQPTLHLGVVIDGRLAIRSTVGGETEATLMTLDRGDIFGWSAVLDGPATATVVALDRARVLSFERDALLGALAADPVLAARVYRRLLEVVEDRLAATRLQMLDLYGPVGRVR